MATPAAMSMSKRLTADPCLGVSDLQKPILQFLKETGSFDLGKLLEPQQAVSWKTAPNLAWLLQLKPLLEKLILVAPACIFPSKKLKVAIEKIQRETSRVNFSKQRDDDFFDRCDFLLRCAAAQLRNLKQEVGQYTRICKKSSVLEKNQLDELLSGIQLPEPEAPKKENSSPSKRGRKGSPKKAVGCTDLVLLQPEVDKQPAVLPSGNIFKKILQRRESDESGLLLPAAEVNQTKASSSGSKGNRPILGLDFSKDEVQLLAEALAQECMTSAEGA